MKIEELIKIVDEGYPDGKVGEYFEDPDGDHGDGLARFIAAEIDETFDPDASREDQLEEAMRVMETAAKEISGVIVALSEADREADAADEEERKLANETIEED